jgi:hypothetical protein
VAAALRGGGLATLLFDLLSEDEAADRRNVFDIELLAGRLALATAWVEQQEDTKSLPIGYFGAAPARPQRWWLRRGCRRFVPLSLAAAVPTWLARCWGRFGHRPCSSWADMTLACWN